MGVSVYMMSVAIHKDFGKRGIGGNMTKVLLENIKNKGYWMSWAECSSHYSMRLLEKHGGTIEK